MCKKHLSSIVKFWEPLKKNEITESLELCSAILSLGKVLGAASPISKRDRRLSTCLVEVDFKLRETEQDNEPRLFVIYSAIC